MENENINENEITTIRVYKKDAEIITTYAKVMNKNVADVFAIFMKNIK